MPRKTDLQKLIQLIRLGAKEEGFGYMYENADKMEGNLIIHNLTISWTTEKSGAEWTDKTDF